MAFSPASSKRRRHESPDKAERRKEGVWGGKYGFLWVTASLFLLTAIGHWAFAWPAYVQEQQEHGDEVQVRGYFIETSRDTLENWQSEFLQLCWQVAALSFLWYVGSPQSKESDERHEQLLEQILKKVDPEEGEKIIKDLKERYPEH